MVVMVWFVINFDFRLAVEILASSWGSAVFAKDSRRVPSYASVTLHESLTRLLHLRSHPSK